MCIDVFTRKFKMKNIELRVMIVLYKNKIEGKKRR